MYKIALIGCGRISFKHIEGIINNAKKLVLTAVCDPVISRAQEKKNEYKKLFQTLVRLFLQITEKCLIK